MKLNSRKNQGAILRDLINCNEGIFAFGVDSAISAKVAEGAGIKCIYAGGYSVAGISGWPDMGIISGTEMIESFRRITKATSLPVVADIDDGYGSVHNVIRTVEDLLETTPVAGFHIEDQKYPKRCGHIAGKEVLPLEEFLGKLQAVIDIRNRLNPSCVIIARTDAFSAVGANINEIIGGDIDEAIRRASAYADAGADIVWCEFPTPDIKSAKAFAEGVRKRHPELPLAFNISPSFTKDMWDASALTEIVLNKMGYKFRFATYPVLLSNSVNTYDLTLKFSHEAIEAMKELKYNLVNHPMENFMKTIGVDKYQEIEKKYSPGAIKRIESSEGFKENS